MTEEGASPPSFLTPAGLSNILAVLGHDVSERRLTDWRGKVLLPKLQQLGRGRRGGSGPVHGWTDPDIVLLAHTLCVAAGRSPKSLDQARLRTWFAGFAYPIDRLREIWREAEAKRWKGTLAQVVYEDFHDDDLPEVLEIALTAVTNSRAKGLLPTQLRRAYFKAEFDPNFDANRMSPSDLDAVAAGASISMAQTSTTKSFPTLPPELVRLFLKLYHDESSPATLHSRIAVVSDSDLTTAHKDVAFLAGAYRAALRSVLMDIGDTTSTRQQAVLAMSPVLAWIAGRGLLILDLALRRHGLTGEVERTVRVLRQLVARDEFQQGCKALGAECRRYESWSPDQLKLAMETISNRLDKNAHIKELQACVSSTLDEIAAIWRSQWTALAQLLAARPGVPQG